MRLNIGPGWRYSNLPDRNRSRHYRGMREEDVRHTIGPLPKLACDNRHGLEVSVSLLRRCIWQSHRAWRSPCFQRTWKYFLNESQTIDVKMWFLRQINPSRKWVNWETHLERHNHRRNVMMADGKVERKIRVEIILNNHYSRNAFFLHWQVKTGIMVDIFPISDL